MYEAQVITGFTISGICARRKELEDDGYIIKTDKTRKGRYGDPNKVWIATESGYAVVEGKR
jgi:hypothetical protein